MGFIENAIPGGQTRYQQRIQDHIDSIHAQYISYIQYTYYYFKQQLDIQKEWLVREQNDAVEQVMKKMLDQISDN